MKQGFLLVFLLVLASRLSDARGDEGLPLPGAITTHPTTVENVIDAATPARAVGLEREGAPKASVQTAAIQSSPLPGASANYQTNLSSKSSYQLLPISASEARTRLDELKTLLLISRPQAIQERIYNLCDWLTEMHDAHSKLANAFAKQEESRGIALTEKATAQKFNQLRNEAQLLKAELLIKQNRSPEALGSLIDIVVADPRSATGKVAYQHLKELGFSEDVPEQILVQMAKETNKQTEPVKQQSAIVKLPTKQSVGRPTPKLVKAKR